jgi:hypothetical protein
MTTLFVVFKYIQLDTIQADSTRVIAKTLCYVGRSWAAAMDFCQTYKTDKGQPLAYTIEAVGPSGRFQGGWVLTDLCVVTDCDTSGIPENIFFYPEATTPVPRKPLYYIYTTTKTEINTNGTVLFNEKITGICDRPDIWATPRCVIVNFAHDNVPPQKQWLLPRSAHRPPKNTTWKPILIVAIVVLGVFSTIF